MRIRMRLACAVVAGTIAAGVAVGAVAFTIGAWYSGHIAPFPALRHLGVFLLDRVERDIPQLVAHHRHADFKQLIAALGELDEDAKRR